MISLQCELKAYRKSLNNRPVACHKVVTGDKGDENTSDDQHRVPSQRSAFETQANAGDPDSVILANWSIPCEHYVSVPYMSHNNDRVLNNLGTAF